jgi:glycosyltransferase involved in cell wall biosynthesis
VRKPPVVVLAGVRWDFLWQRHQTLATLFARTGYPTVFVETTGLSAPKLERKSFEHVLRRMSKAMRRSAARSEPSPEANLSVYSPLVLPPTGGFFRRTNERFFVPRIARDLRKMAGDSPVVIAYPPTRTTLDVIARLEPRLVFYDCADEYAAFPGAPDDIAATERELLRRADLVSCTSGHLLDRVKRLRPDAFLSRPGVEYELFEPLAREETPGDIRTVCYFGDLDAARTDFAVLRAIVGAGFRLRLVGEARGAARRFVRSPGVEYVGAVAHRNLPRAISGADAFVLPYKINALTLGISPAKTYECLATGKPVVSAALPAVKELAEHVYIAEETEDFVEILKNLGSSESGERSEARRELARKNSWEVRVAEIEEKVCRKLGEG